MTRLVDGTTVVPRRSRSDDPCDRSAVRSRCNVREWRSCSGRRRERSRPARCPSPLGRIRGGYRPRQGFTPRGADDKRRDATGTSATRTAGGRPSDAGGPLSGIRRGSNLGRWFARRRRERFRVLRCGRLRRRRTDAGTHGIRQSPAHRARPPSARDGHRGCLRTLESPDRRLPLR